MKKLLIGLTVFFLAITATLVTRDVMVVGAARDAAQTALPAVQTATDDVLATLIEDATGALRAWTPGETAPAAPLTVAEEYRRGGEAADTLAVVGSDVRVRVTADSLIVILDLGDDGQMRRRGVIPAEAFRARLIEAAAVGAQADAYRDVVGRWSRVQLLAAGTGDVLLALDPAAKPKKEDGALSGSMPSAKDIFDSGDTRTRAQAAVAAGEASAPRDYKDSSGETATGTWARSAVVPDIWVVAEIRDSVAVMEVVDKPTELFGIEIGRIYPWHGTLALTVIFLIATVFLGLQSRGVEYSQIARVFGFVRPYVGGVVAVILLGLGFMGANIMVKIFIMRQLVDEVLTKTGPEAEQMLWEIGGKTVVLAFVIAGLGYGKAYLHNYYATAIMADIRYAIGSKIVSLPLSFFDKMRAGDLVARIERDAASMRTIYNNVFKTGAIVPFQLVGLVVAAFVVNSRLAVVLIGMPIIVLPLFRIAKRIKKRAKKRQILLAEISHVIFQMLSGIKVVKAFGGEEREALRLRTVIHSFVAQARRIHRLSALSESLLDLLQLIGAAIVIVAGGFFVLDGVVTVGDLVSFFALIQQIYKGSKQLTNTANSLVNALPGVNRVFEVLDAESDIVDGPDTLERKSLASGIRFENVSFAYGEKHVLSDVTLDIPAGQVVAIVGPTGAGKSTLCDLVARFYDPSEGAILYDGVDIRTYTLKSLLTSIALVTQDAFLFNAPLDENIRYSKPDATQEEIELASRDAFVHDEIERMEGGYQKLAGERGGSVSGGQRQRITIARAILKNAPVLILDEATSALDSHAEKQVQAALDKLMSGRTVIVVAHRLSTIRNADKIVVMREGRIIEEGAPDDLLQREDGHFKQMYDLQMGKERAERGGHHSASDRGALDDGDARDDGAA